MGYAYYVGAYKKYVTEAPEAIPASDFFFQKGVPVACIVNFYLPRPKSPANPYPVGDLDNYAKSILDAITKNGTYWHDDAQVVSLQMHKIYTKGEPRTEVSIYASTVGHLYEDENGDLK